MPRIAEKNPKLKLSRIFIANFIGGMAWALGMTAGFAILVYIVSQILSALGGLPVIGTFFADIIANTLEALNAKAPKL